MVAIRLFHGRKDPKENLDDWGLDGPILGPFDGVHITYLSHIRAVVDKESLGDINYYEDLVYYDGVYYGDMVIMSWDEAKKAFSNKIQQFDPDKCNY